MHIKSCLTYLLLVGLWFASPLIAPAAQRSGAGQAKVPDGAQATLRVMVLDPQGAAIVSAQLKLQRSGGLGRSLVTDQKGEALFSALAPGKYGLHIEADGFKPLDIDKVNVKTGNKPLEVHMAVAGANEEISVKQDPREKMTDPNSNAFSTVLTQDQINAMPDDPDEFEAALKQMAGPGGLIRVNGFLGGKLPPKSQIREIRIHRNQYAAENHEAGFIGIDIYTKPGADLWHGSVNGGYRDSDLMARNAFASIKGPAQYRRFGADADGPIWKDHTSVFFSAQGMLSYSSKTVVAELPEGLYRTLVEPLSRTLYLSGRAEQVLTKTHTLRLEYQRNANLQGDQGVGNFDLPERAYSTNTVEHILRVSDSGLITKRLVNELRMQEILDDVHSGSATQAPAIIVSGAFDSGGAQVQASKRTSDLQVADNVDFATGKNAFRTGVLLDSFNYNTRDRQNNLGTFTFPNLAAYIAGRPEEFFQQAGNPQVGFTENQFGWYIQDDFRARKNLSLSLGFRQEVQSNPGSAANFAPRFGIAWSPTSKMVIRAGTGIFYSWLSPDNYEQIIRDDGLHEHDLLVLNPGFPNPLAGGLVDVLPPGKTLLASSIKLPYVWQSSIGLERQLHWGITFNADYMYSHGVHLFHGEDINAPRPGKPPPDPAAGVINQVESSADSTLNLFSVGVNKLTRRFAFFAVYIWSKSIDNTDGALSLPSNSFDLVADRGPSSDDMRHRFFSNFNMSLFKGLSIGAFFHVNSATPYNITTGFDNNGDGVFNDRQAGVGRNSARGAGDWEMSTRLSWSVGFGKPRVGGGPKVFAKTNKVGDGDQGGGMLPGIGGENAKRWNCQFYIQAYNLFNHENPINFIGVETSPFFGQPTAAQVARRLETGMRFSF